MSKKMKNDNDDNRDDNFSFLDFVFSIFLGFFILFTFEKARDDVSFRMLLLSGAAGSMIISLLLMMFKSRSHAINEFIEGIRKLLFMGSIFVVFHVLVIELIINVS